MQLFLPNPGGAGGGGRGGKFRKNVPNIFQDNGYVQGDVSGDVTS